MHGDPSKELSWRGVTSSLTYKINIFELFVLGLLICSPAIYFDHGLFHQFVVVIQQAARPLSELQYAYVT